MSVADTAARAAADLRIVIAVPHTEGFRRTALIRAKVAVARALVDAALAPTTTPAARRRFHATLPGHEARMAAYHDLPETQPELLAALDALAIAPQEEAAA